MDGIQTQYGVQYPLIIIDISYFLEYGYEKTTLFLLNIYNNSLFKQNIRFVQSTYSEQQNLNNLRSNNILNELSKVLKSEINHSSFFDSEENTIGNLFFKKFFINWEYLNESIKTQELTKKGCKITQMNIERLKNLIEIGNTKPHFLAKYIKFKTNEEKERFYKKEKEVPNNKKKDKEIENLKHKKSDYSFREIPFLLQKLGTFESSLDSLRLCPIFYESIENIINNYTDLTVPYILNFEEEEKKEKINFLENFGWFDKLLYQIFRGQLYLKHEYYDFKIEEILNNFLEIEKENCCNKNITSIFENYFDIEKHKIENFRMDLRFKEYKTHYLQENKIEDSLLDEAKIDITLLESESEYKYFDSDTSFNKTIEFIEVKRKEGNKYIFKPTQPFYTNTSILNLPFCLCGFLYNFISALKYKLQSKTEIDLKCTGDFKILRAPFFINWICNILRDKNEWTKIQILFSDLCLLKKKLNIKEHLCKKVEESIFENYQNSLKEGKEHLIEILEGNLFKNRYLNTLLVYITFINKTMILTFIYNNLPKKKKYLVDKNFINKLIKQITQNINCLLKLYEDPCDIILSAIECFFFFSSTVYTPLIQRLERIIKKNTKRLININRDSILLVEQIQGEMYLRNFKFFYILYLIFGDDQLIEKLQKIRIQNAQVINTQIEVEDLREIKTFSLRYKLFNDNINKEILPNDKVNSGLFTKILNDLKTPENIKCVDEILNYNKKEIVLIENIKLLLKLGYEKEALEKLKFCTSHRATNLINKFRSNGEQISLKKQKLNTEIENYDALGSEKIYVLGEKDVQ